MGTLTRTALRQRLSSALSAVSGLTVSAFAPGLFGDDSRREMAGRFVVGLGRTEPVAQDRQRRAEGIYCETPVQVQLGHRFRADAQLADLDAASTSADTATAALLAASLLEDCQIYLVGVSQDLTAAAEFVLTTIDLRVFQRLPAA